jgi:hypothetical protein
LADSPQKALNLYERSYTELVELKVSLFTAKQEAERNATPPKEYKQPSIPSEMSEYPVRKTEESNIDYRLRCAEWSQNNKKQ